MDEIQLITIRDHRDCVMSSGVGSSVEETVAVRLFLDLMKVKSYFILRKVPSLGGSHN